MSASNRPSSRHLVLLATVLCAALATVACSKGSDKKSTSQVAVKVNGEELSVHQVDLVMRRQAANVPPAQQDAAAKRILEGLVDQELAAQAAKKDKLDQDPRIVQQMEAAKRDVLARAYLERLGEKVTEPSSDEIDRYYETHPNLFSQRRLYSLQETNFSIDPQKAAAMKARLEATTSLEKLNEVLRGELKEGQSLVLTRDGTGRVLTLINAQLAPVGPVPAKRLISGYLTNDRKRTTLQEGVKALREQGKIEYQGRFAQLVSGAASAPAAAPEAAPASAP